MGVSMEFIQSKDNKTIKRIISLGQRKNRQKYGEYIVEGIRSIRDIAAMGAVKTIVIRESKAQDKHVLDLLDLDTVQFVPKFIAQDPIFDKVDNTVNGQGVVAIVSKPKYDMESIHIDDGLYITLDGDVRIAYDDSDDYVHIICKSYGHIKVDAQLGGSWRDNWVKLVLNTDQTVLNEVIQQCNSILKN